MSISIMLYISVFCKHIETHLNIGYNLVCSDRIYQQVKGYTYLALSVYHCSLVSQSLNSATLFSLIYTGWEVSVVRIPFYPVAGLSLTSK